MRIRSSVAVLIAAFVLLGVGSIYVVGSLPDDDPRQAWRPPEGDNQRPGSGPADGGEAPSRELLVEVVTTLGPLRDLTGQSLPVATVAPTTASTTPASDQPGSQHPDGAGPEIRSTTTADTDDGTITSRAAPSERSDGLPDGQRIYGVMTRGGTDTEIDDFIQAAGRNPNLIGVTAGWAEHDYTPWYTERIALMGAVPMISWEPWDASKEGTVDQERSEQPDFAVAHILNGEFDDYIDGWAQGLAAWGRPVMLRFAHEMNGYWYPWADGRNGNQPGAYAATWRYVHDRFTAAGADNVLWVWSPNVAYTGSTPLAGLYPGDEYVDWVGVVGYYGHFAGQPTSQPGFDGIFGPTLDQLEGITTRPIFITETGAGPYGELKAAWITDAVGAFAADPRVQGFVWFNVDKEFNWRIDSSPEALSAFRAAVANPAFGEGNP